MSEHQALDMRTGAWNLLQRIHLPVHPFLSSFPSWFIRRKQMMWDSIHSLPVSSFENGFLEDTGFIYCFCFAWLPKSIPVSICCLVEAAGLRSSSRVTFFWNLSSRNKFCILSWNFLWLSFFEDDRNALWHLLLMTHELLCVFLRSVSQEQTLATQIH